MLPNDPEQGTDSWTVSEIVPDNNAKSYKPCECFVNENYELGNELKLK